MKYKSAKSIFRKSIIVSGFLICGVSLSLARPPVTMNTLEQGHMLADIDLFDDSYEPDEGALIGRDGLTNLLGTIHEKSSKTGLNFYIEQAFNQSWIDNATPGTHSHQTWYLLHAHAAFNLIGDDFHQGTWLRVELSGSSMLNKSSKESETLNDAFGTSGALHNDVFYDGLYYLPEILISQGFAKGSGVVMFGIINQANYLDVNSYANSSFGQFTNAVFVNNQVLPLADANFGILIQGQLANSCYIQIGANMIDSQPDQNPFRNTRGRNFNIVGEAGWIKDDMFGMGAGAVRLQPFVFHHEGGNLQAGVALNLEQDLGMESPFAIYSRTGWSKADDGNIGGASFQTSAGLIIKKPLEILGVTKEGGNNFFGLGFAVTRPDKDCMAETCNSARRELTFECTYNFAVTRFLSIQPTFQYVHNPAGRDDANHACIFAVQSVLYF